MYEITNFHITNKTINNLSKVWDVRYLGCNPLA